MTHRRYPTLAEETLDQALDALVRGDARALDRLGRHAPDLQASVEEVFALADLSGFADEGNAWAEPDRETGERAGSAIDTDQGGPPTPLPGPVRLDPWSRRQWMRITTVSAAAALLVAIIGTTAFLAVRGDDRDDLQPVMMEAASADPTPESRRELLDLPASTQPLTVADPETLGFGGMASAGATVVRLLATPEFTGVEAVDANTDTVAWRLATPWRSAGISAGASGVYFVAGPNRLVAVDPATGADLWQVSLGAPIVSMALQDADLREDTLYVWDESSTMTAIDTATGDPVWDTTTSDPGGPQRRTAGPAMPGVAPAIGETLVVMVAANGTLNAFDRSSGEIAWSNSGYDGIDTRLAINLDRLLVLSTLADAPDGLPNLIGIGVDLLTGNAEWTVHISGPLLKPAASEEAFFYLVADAIFPISGVREITPEYVDYAECCAEWTPAADPDSLTDTGGPRVFGIDTRTGRVIWSRVTRAANFIAAKTTFPQSGSLLAVTFDGQLIQLQRESGGIMPDPIDLGGHVVDIIPVQDEIVQYVVSLDDGTLISLRRTSSSG